MKKSLSLLIILFSFLLLSSCNDTISYNQKITMELPTEIKEILTYKGSLPSLDFIFEGSFNVYKTSASNSGYVFTKNDNYLLSEALANHLNSFDPENIITVSKTKQESDDVGALFGKTRLPLDPDTSSFEYLIVAWDNTGTRYSYRYRSFSSNNKIYYAYTYNTGITINMETPLLVQKINDVQQVFLINLPYDTTYMLNANMRINALQNNSEYLNEIYHSFEYPNYVKFSETKIQDIKDWYIKYCEGYEENDLFFFTYLGIKYYINFLENSFLIYVDSL